MKAPLPASVGCVEQVTPDQCRCLVPDGRPMRSLTTTRDIADGGGFLVGPLVQDQMGRAGEHQEFSRHTQRIGSQSVYTTARLESPSSRGLHRGSANGSAI